MILALIILAAIAIPNLSDFPEDSECNWDEFLCGPAEWYHDSTGVEISSIHPAYYERVWNPEVITIHYGDVTPCEHNQIACAIAEPEKCDVYLPEITPEGVEEHELKHCYGWSHPEKGPYLWRRNDSF